MPDEIELNCLGLLSVAERPDRSQCNTPVQGARDIFSNVRDDAAAPLHGVNCACGVLLRSEAEALTICFPLQLLIGSLMTQSQSLALLPPPLPLAPLSSAHELVTHLTR